MGKKTVLVVDDSNTLRRICTFNLKKSGFNVLEAVDGIDAIDKMRANQVDIVILDIMMPRLDGFGVLKEMKRDERLSSIPVIMLTAKGGEDDEKSAVKFGASEFLTKPFSPKELVSRVKELTND
ncbi:MAG: two-component system response regulator [Thermotoga sp.]|nr:MAG: two-component system response regulator [Thermotoga sp.]